MAHPSDLAPVLAALEAQVIIAGTEGGGKMNLLDFFTPANAFTETVLQPGQLLTGVQIPNQKGRTYQSFLKHRIRHASDFALSSAAVVARITEGICEDIRIVLGGIAALPYRASRAEEILRGNKLAQEVILQAAEAPLAEAHPLTNNRYKLELSKALVRRALTSIWHEATGVS